MVVASTVIAASDAAPAPSIRSPVAVSGGLAFHRRCNVAIVNIIYRSMLTLSTPAPRILLNGAKTRTKGGQTRLSPWRPGPRPGRYRAADDSGRRARGVDPARRRGAARRLPHRALPPFRRQ